MCKSHVTLRPRDTLVAVCADDVPATASSNFLKFTKLVLYRLGVGGKTEAVGSNHAAGMDADAIAPTNSILPPGSRSSRTRPYGRPGRRAFDHRQCDRPRLLQDII